MVPLKLSLDPHCLLRFSILQLYNKLIILHTIPNVFCDYLCFYFWKGCPVRLIVVPVLTVNWMLGFFFFCQLICTITQWMCYKWMTQHWTLTLHSINAITYVNRHNNAGFYWSSFGDFALGTETDHRPKTWYAATKMNSIPTTTTIIVVFIYYLLLSSQFSLVKGKQW